MANRFFNPNEQFCDATGLPYAGGSLTFYASGTTTPLNTYSDKALSIANTNPVVLDSAGRAGSIFLQNLAYKVVLSDVNSNVIWTFDPVYASDFSTVAQFQSGNGSPNGSVAGTAGSSTIPASSYWDATNNILYICTQTGTTSTAVWTAVNAASAAAVIPPPQGYLTLTSGTPVITSDVVSATSVFYTPYVGNLIPIYNGTSFVPTIFAELSLTLVANHAANTIYDLFVFNNTGVLTLVTGPAWSNSGAGTGSRGSGAGTTQLTRISGILVNNVSMTGRNGSTTYSISANQATYVGSIYIDAVAGQVTCHRSWGQSRKFGIWNAYNRQQITLQVGDNTASWNNASASIRSANGVAANNCTIFSGLAEELFSVKNIQLMGLKPDPASALHQFVRNGIGLNSTTVFSGTQGQVGSNAAANGSVQNWVESTATATFIAPPQLGISTVNAIEQGNSAASVTVLLYGTQASFSMETSWRG